jgi:SAM-dependent methyltransferase
MTGEPSRSGHPGSPLRCPICEAPEPVLFLEREDVPVHQNLLLRDERAARLALRGRLAMHACGACGFVFNVAFDPSRLSYGDDYDNTQTHSPAFEAYVDRLVQDMVTRHGVRDARVVEVGCGKGGFLRKLVSQPGAGNRGVGFDPSYVGPDQDLDGALRFERRFYDEQCADLPADVVVCRHVIEHVQDPLALLGSVRKALALSPQARVHFETPCVEWILRQQVTWDLFYEHCSLFSPGSLRLAFERSGYAVDAVEPVFGEQYLWLRGCVGSCADPVRTSGDQVLAWALTYGQREAQRRQRWREQLALLCRAGPVAVWGAGAKGMTFANLADPDASTLDCLIDVNPAKQGCHVPGSAQPILAPDALSVRGVRHVILMNPNYRQEVQQWLDRANCRAELCDWS